MSPTSCQTAPPRVRFGEEVDFDILFTTSQHIVLNWLVVCFKTGQQREEGANSSKLGITASTDARKVRDYVQSPVVTRLLPHSAIAYSLLG